MPDEPQTPRADEAQEIPYPYFKMTETGLSRLYQEYGRLMHLSIEQGVGQEQIRAQTRQLQAATRQFTARHGDGKCRPAEAENGHATIPTVADVLGVPEEAVELVPASRRRKGG